MHAGRISIPDSHAHYFFVYCQQESALNRLEDMKVDNAFQPGKIYTQPYSLLQTTGRPIWVFKYLMIIQIEQGEQN